MKTFFLSCKEVRIEPTSPKTYYGCFYLGPFETGQGLTVANALRRTLLSEISGLAITSVKIDQVSHEYSTLKGVRETVLDILLNLKEIVLVKTIKKALLRTQIGYLQVRGPGVVRASDLKLPPTIQCVDPDQYIATLTEDACLTLKIQIDEGKNFVLSQNNFHFTKFNGDNGNLSKSNDTFLSIDAVFTLIKKVNYTIEYYSAKSIQKANQVVILEVWTNGGISPKEAISQALNYLRVLFHYLGQLQILQSMVTTYSLAKNQDFRKVVKKLDINLDSFQSNLYEKRLFQSKIGELPGNDLPFFIQNQLEIDYLEEIQKQTFKGWELRNISELGLPFRVFNCFYKANIQTVGEILKMNLKDLQRLPGFGQQSLIILTENLKLKGLTLNKR